MTCHPKYGLKRLVGCRYTYRHTRHCIQVWKLSLKLKFQWALFIHEYQVCYITGTHTLTCLTYTIPPYCPIPYYSPILGPSVCPNVSTHLYLHLETVILLAFPIHDFWDGGAIAQEIYSTQLATRWGATVLGGFRTTTVSLISNQVFVKKKKSTRYDRCNWHLTTWQKSHKHFHI